MDNYRILIIDDNTAIHKDFSQILQVKQKNDHLAELGEEIFGEKSELAETANYSYTVESAFQGEQGLNMVIHSLNETQPYALAFVDMRMPPGWDGLETIEQIWKVDPNIQIVICTAYSDHSWDDIQQRFARSYNLLILKKPFDAIEVKQICHALTEKWSLFHRLNLALEKAEDASRVKSDFLNTISHELKTPLTVILANISLLKDIKRLPDPTTIGEISTDIEDSATQLMEMVEKILDFTVFDSKNKQLYKKTVLSTDLLEKAIEMIDQKIKKKRLHFIRRIEFFSLICDPERVTQILYCLLDNAVKFTEAGYIGLKVKKMNGMAVFKVYDTGPGISKNSRNQIFELFRQLENPLTRTQGGIGLGLTAVKQLVEAHGGTISVKARGNRGSIFTFTIPQP